MKSFTYTLYGDVLGNEASARDYKYLAMAIEGYFQDDISVHVVKKLRTIGATPNPISDLEGLSQEEAEELIEEAFEFWYEAQHG